MPVRGVVVEDLLRHALRRPHERGPALDGVLDRPEARCLPDGVRPVPPARRRRDLALVDRAVLLDRLLRRVGEEQPARARPDEPVRRVVPVRRVLLAVAVDEHLVVLARLQRVGADDRVPVPGREVDREARRRRPVPDPERPGERPRQRRRVLQRVAVPPAPADVLLRQQQAQQLVVLLEVLVLLVEVQPEQRVLQHLVALADDDLQPPAAQLVDRREVLGDADRVEQRQHGDARAQQDARRPRRDRAEEHRRRRRQHLSRVPLPHRERVEPELLRQHRRLHDPVQPVGRRDRLPGHGVGRVEHDVEYLEPHVLLLVVRRRPGGRYRRVRQLRP